MDRSLGYYQFFSRSFELSEYLGFLDCILQAAQDVGYLLVGMIKLKAEEKRVDKFMKADS